jgi:hypothetical protein
LRAVGARNDGVLLEGGCRMADLHSERQLALLDFPILVLVWKYTSLRITIS